MPYDTKIPKLLKDHQQWFASIITRPLVEDRMVSNESIEAESAHYIDKSPTLKPHERIQIYNQQYWWRLLNVLHEAFPLLTRLFGYYEFNHKIGFPYLAKYPSQYFSIDHIGERLCQWIEEVYIDEDKPLIQKAVAIDWAFSHSFTAKHFPPLSLSDLTVSGEELMEKTLYLQPHVHLFALKSNLFEFRRTFIQKKVEHWEENDFPSLEKEKDFYFVLSRDCHNDIRWMEICPGEYEMLSLFREGSTLCAACEWLEGREDLAADSEIQVWLQDWVVAEWLTINNTPDCVQTVI